MACLSVHIENTSSDLDSREASLRAAIKPFTSPGPFLFLSPYYSIRMWLHGPIGLDLCSPQPPVFEAFYGYLVLTVLEIYLLG
jgi:hypothetical protein